MKTILVPIDYSKAARQAFVFGLELARKLDLELVLFHAFHQPIGVENAYHLEESIQALENEKNNGLKSWAKKVQNEIYQDFCWEFNNSKHSDLEEQNLVSLTPSGNHTIEVLPKPKSEVKIKYACKFGLADEEIIQAAQTYKAELILISSRGAGPIGQTLLGSTVAEVIAKSPISVFTLPPHGLIRQPKSIVLAASLNQLPENSGFEPLRKLVNGLKANLTILHLYAGDSLSVEQQKVQKGLEILDAQLYDVSYKVYLRQNEAVVSGIQEFMQQQQADLLVLQPHRHPFLDLLLNHSITEKIIQYGAIPFLTLPPSLGENAIQKKIKQEQKTQSH